MENSNLDETMPTPVKPEQDLTSNLEATQPSALNSSQADMAETQPVEIRPQTYAPPQELVPPSPTPPIPDASTTPPPRGPAPTQTRLNLRSWSLIGIAALILVAVLSAFGGYSNGIAQRKSAEATQIALTLDDQFVLGVQDLEGKRYDLARQRFEYIIKANPLYPGAADKLADTLLAMNTRATPTVAATPTLTPTPDTRGVDEKFTQAQQDLTNFEWTKAIETLLSLRKADPNYLAVWVDNMLYMAFRNRGKEKILSADLEGGIYDMTVAEQYGYLDTDSQGMLTWARLYITGASFWEIDWAQAVYYFAQLAPAVPNLMDGSGWTASERYRLALKGYGDFLVDQGEWCAALEQFELSLSYGPDAEIDNVLPEVSAHCGGDEDEEGEEDGGTVEVTPTPSEEPVVTVEPTTEPAPTDEPTTEPPPQENPTDTPNP